MIAKSLKKIFYTLVITNVRVNEWLLQKKVLQEKKSIFYSKFRIYTDELDLWLSLNALNPASMTYMNLTASNEETYERNHCFGTLAQLDYDGLNLAMENVKSPINGRLMSRKGLTVTWYGNTEKSAKEVIYK